MGKVIMSGRVPKLVAPVGLPAKAALNDMSWADIRTISDAGQAANYWAVGDTKTIVLNGKAGGANNTTTFSNLSIDVFIIGINHNSAKEGSNRVHFQIGKIGGTAVALCDNNWCMDTDPESSYTMNSYEENYGGWKSSRMRSAVLGSDASPNSPTADTLLACLPSDLRAVMKSATKYTDNTGNCTNYSYSVTATTDYLWLLSEFEVAATADYSNDYEQNSQAQYDYYKAGNSAAKYKHQSITTPTTWFLRSPDSRTTTLFLGIQNNGTTATLGANWSYGIAPAFCV